MEQNKETLIDKINSLQLALETDNEGIATYLKQIHANLLQFPELIHMLKPDEVSSIVQGLQQLSDLKLESKPKRVAKSKTDLASLLAGI